jgi:hypothetical protein
MSVIQPQVGYGCIDGHLSGGGIAECDENLCGTNQTACRAGAVHAAWSGGSVRHRYQFVREVVVACT